jgi:hypothetical protein
MAGRAIDQGALGCPICDARYPIDHGGIVFDRSQRDRCWATEPAQPPSAERVLRAAALLGLVDPGGIILLGGAEGGGVAQLRDQVDVSAVLYNPLGRVAGWDGVTPMYSDRPPLAPAVLRGAILDTATAGAVGHLVDALRVGGRLVAPVNIAVPSGVRELARDEEQWVAERVAESVTAPVALRRGAPPQPSG